MKLQAKPQTLRNADPAGRVDVAFLRGAEALARKLGGGRAWDLGLGDVAEVVVENMGLPREPLTAVDVARRLGLVPDRKPQRRKQAAAVDDEGGR